MNEWNIPLFKIYWDQTDIDAVTATIKKGVYWAIGPNIELFEKSIADYVGTKYALAFNSGTSALHSALLALGIGKGDEVIVPSFTFIATANAPLFVGATPVFADIEERTLGLDPADVEKKITSRTRAIIPIHYAGNPCLIRELKTIADRHGLALIEDAAEAMGATYDNKQVGSFGNVGIFSFCSNKIISTGEGGAITTNDQNTVNSLRKIRSHGRTETENYFTTNELMDYVRLGYNFRMSDITASLGITQLNKIEMLIAMRREKAALYDAKLKNVSGIRLFPGLPKHKNVYQMYPILVQSQRDRLVSFLSKRGIMSKVYFPSVHESQYYKNVLKIRTPLPVTEKISRQILTLPLFPHISEQEVDYVVDGIKTFIEKNQ